jgi:hypothetical protein
MGRVVGVIAIILGVLMGLTGAAAAAIVGPDDTITIATHRLTAPSPSSAIASAPGLIIQSKVSTAMSFRPQQIWFVDEEIAGVQSAPPP